MNLLFIAIDRDVLIQGCNYIFIKNTFHTIKVLNVIIIVDYGLSY